MVADSSLRPDICSSSLKLFSLKKYFFCKLPLERSYLLMIYCERVEEAGKERCRSEGASEVDARHHIDLRPVRLKVARHT